MICRSFHPIRVPVPLTTKMFGLRPFQGQQKNFRRVMLTYLQNRAAAENHTLSKELRHYSIYVSPYFRFRFDFLNQTLSDYNLINKGLETQKLSSRFTSTHTQEYTRDYSTVNLFPFPQVQHQLYQKGQISRHKVQQLQQNFWTSAKTLLNLENNWSSDLVSQRKVVSHFYSGLTVQKQHLHKSNANHYTGTGMRDNQFVTEYRHYFDQRIPDVLRSYARASTDISRLHILQARLQKHEAWLFEVTGLTTLSQSKRIRFRYSMQPNQSLPLTQVKNNTKQQQINGLIITKYRNARKNSTFTTLTEIGLKLESTQKYMHRNLNILRSLTVKEKQFTLYSKAKQFLFAKTEEKHITQQSTHQRTRLKTLTKHKINAPVENTRRVNLAAISPVEVKYRETAKIEPQLQVIQPEPSRQPTPPQVDVNQISRVVMQQIQKRLRVERERRGLL